MAGYSGTPLPQKLGIRDGGRVSLVGAPAGLEELLRPLPDGVTISTRLGPADVILFFTRAAAPLAKRFPALIKALRPGGSIWIAWPKKASGVATDVTENVVRDIGLPLGVVDTKVCAIDETWSGLRFQRRRT
jgi:hypothetical protein